jgi:Uncharacterised nucleotidyltransferase
MTRPSEAGDSAALRFGLRAAYRIATPEFRLVVACCRWPPSPRRDAAIRNAAESLSDWSCFQWLVDRHRVAGLVHDALALAQIEHPAAVAEALTARARHIARRNLLLVSETVRLQRALETAGIPSLMLKGVGLAQLAYGSLGTKDTRDIDLLIPPDRAEMALHTLKREGYVLLHPATQLNKAQCRAVFRFAREVQLLRPGKGLLVEMQWRPTNNPLLLKGVDVHSATQSVVLSDGVSIRTLAPDPLFAYLCVHGAQHAWSRLKWLADFNALTSANGADLLRLYRYAQSVGAGPCAGQALLLGKRLFDLDLPAALAAEVERDRRLRHLAAIAIETMCDDDAEPNSRRSFSGRMRVVCAQFLLGKGLAFLLAQYATVVITLDIIELPLPRALHFLYPALRLPLWLWRRVKSTIKSAAKSVRALGPTL